MGIFVLCMLFFLLGVVTESYLLSEYQFKVGKKGKRGKLAKKHTDYKWRWG